MNKMMCPVCNSPQKTTVHSKVEGFNINQTFDLEKCAECATIFTSPALSPSERASYYDKQIVAFNGVGGTDLIEDYKQHKQKYWKKLKYTKRYAEIKKVAPNAKTILDIGCGAGIFVDYMVASGADAYGLELSDWGYKTAKSLGLNVIQKDYVDLSPKDHLPEFDVITMYDVIEHSTNPTESLKKVYSLLSDDGVIIVNVPNFASTLSKAAGPQWNKLIPPDHTLHFTKATITDLLKKSGFAIVSSHTNNGSPYETTAELAAAFWKIPGKVFKPFRVAYSNKDKPRSDHPSTYTDIVKLTQKTFYRLGFLSYLLFPIFDLFETGEGLHIIARKK